MQNLRSLLRVPLLKLSSGEQIGEVQEVVLDINRALVYGIKLLDEHSGVAFSNLVIGRDAIMVRSLKVILDCKELFPEEVILSAELFDKEIYTDTGFNLGILADILYSNVTGEIKSYEVSDSLLSDLIDGRKLMPFPPVQVIGQDKIIVPQAMSKLLSLIPK